MPHWVQNMLSGYTARRRRARLAFIVRPFQVVLEGQVDRIYSISANPSQPMSFQKTQASLQPELSHNRTSRTVSRSTSTGRAFIRQVVVKANCRCVLPSRLNGTRTGADAVSQLSFG